MVKRAQRKNCESPFKSKRQKKTKNESEEESEPEVSEFEIDSDIFSESDSGSNYESESSFAADAAKYLTKSKKKINRRHGCFMCGVKEYETVNFPSDPKSIESFATTRKHWNALCSLLNLNSVKFDENVLSAPTILKMYHSICVNCSASLANIHTTLTWIVNLEKKLNELVTWAESSLRSYAKSQVFRKPRIDRFVRAFYSSVLDDFEQNESGEWIDQSESDDICTIISQKYWKAKLTKNFTPLLSSSDENVNTQQQLTLTVPNAANTPHSTNESQLTVTTPTTPNKIVAEIELNAPLSSPLTFDEPIFQEEAVLCNSESEVVANQILTETEKSPNQNPSEADKEGTSNRNHTTTPLRSKFFADFSIFGGAAGDALDQKYNLSKYYEYEYAPYYSKGPEIYRCLHRKTNAKGEHLSRMCGAILRFKSTIRRHILQVHLQRDKPAVFGNSRTRILKCPEEGCKSRAANNRNLKAHILSVHHNDPTPYHCDMEGCTKKFKSEKGLKLHLSDFHKLENIIPKTRNCGVCGLACASEAEYRKHRVTEHRTEAQFRSYLDAYPHCCKKCGIPFKEKEELKHHIRLHTGLEPFKCVVCSETLKNRRKLRHHCLAKHSPVPQCSVCLIGFATRQTFRKHLQKHRTDSNLCEEDKEKIENQIAELYRKHTCKLCGLQYAVEGLMLRHYDKCSQEKSETPKIPVTRDPNLPPFTKRKIGRPRKYPVGFKPKYRYPKPFGPQKNPEAKLSSESVPKYPPGHELVKPKKRKECISKKLKANEEIMKPKRKRGRPRKKLLEEQTSFPSSFINEVTAKDTSSTSQPDVNYIAPLAEGLNANQSFAYVNHNNSYSAYNEITHLSTNTAYWVHS